MENSKKTAPFFGGKNDKNVSYELGSTFTWINPEYANQKGWQLEQEHLDRIADGTIKYLIIALDAETLEVDGGLGGIEIILNSQVNGICLDYKSFPWCWDTKTQTGGYTSYNDLMNSGYASLDSKFVYLKYEIPLHPDYKNFKTEMASADWGQISVQYGIGMRHFPFANAYLQG